MIGSHNRFRNSLPVSSHVLHLVCHLLPDAVFRHFRRNSDPVDCGINRDTAVRFNGQLEPGGMESVDEFRRRLKSRFPTAEDDPTAFTRLGFHRVDEFREVHCAATGEFCVAVEPAR